MRASRGWLAANGPKSKRSTLLTFRLARNGRVFFTVIQVSPVCRVVGHFSFRGHAGVNRVPFKGKFHGEPLLPGTYRVNAHARHGLRVLHVTVVVVDSGPPTTTELRQMRHSNVCGSMRALTSNGASRAGASGFASASQPLRKPSSKKSVVVRNQNPSGTPSAAGPPVASPPPFSPGRIAKNVTDPIIVAALAIAVLLLGLAALPQGAVPDPRLTDVLVRHRAEVALAGAGALAAALLALALG